jgi:bile acid:Na+ symporter, BASS family
MLAHLIPLAIQVSMGLIIFCVGLHARFEDITALARKPGLLIRSLLAMNVVMPVVAVLIALLFDLNVVVEAALIAMALSPIPPILPSKEIKAGGEASYIIGVLVATALLSIVFVPLVSQVVGELFRHPLHVSPATVAKIVSTSILLPLLAGICLRLVAKSLANRIAKPLSIVGTVLLVAAFVPVLIAQWHSLGALVGNFTLVAIVAFALVGLAAGHLLGGPDPDDRTVLALSTATRHPAVAMAIVHDAHDKQSVLAAVLLVLMVGSLVSVPYVKWRRRSHDASLSGQRPAAL